MGRQRRMAERQQGEPAELGARSREPAAVVAGHRPQRTAPAALPAGVFCSSSPHCCHRRIAARRLSVTGSGIARGAAPCGTSDSPDRGADRRTPPGIAANRAKQRTPSRTACSTGKRTPGHRLAGRRTVAGRRWAVARRRIIVLRESRSGKGHQQTGGGAEGENRAAHVSSPQNCKRRHELVIVSGIPPSDNRGRRGTDWRLFAGAIF